MECLSPGLGRMGAERSGKPGSWAGTQNVVPSPEHRFCLPLHLFTSFNPDASLVGQAHPQPLFFYTKSHSLVVTEAGLCVSDFWPLHLFRSDRTPCLSSGRVYIKGESLRRSPPGVEAMAQSVTKAVKLGRCVARPHRPLLCPHSQSPTLLPFPTRASFRHCSISLGFQLS